MGCGILSHCALVVLACAGCACSSASTSTHAAPIVVDIAQSPANARAERGGEDLTAFEDRGDDASNVQEDGASTHRVTSVRGPDRDGDGVGDEEDRCPSQPEDRDGFADDDGCPDTDNDSDGIPDITDKCPNEPETMNGFEDEDGCPDENLNQAKAAFKQGVQAFQQGNYAEARKYFEQAYSLEPRDAVLYNIAMAAFYQGDKVAACRYYAQWSASPMGQARANSPGFQMNCP